MDWKIITKCHLHSKYKINFLKAIPCSMCKKHPTVPIWHTKKYEVHEIFKILFMKKKILFS